MYMKYSQNKAFDFNTMSKDGRFEKIASRIFLFMMITIAVIVCLGENAYAAKNPNYEVRSNTGLYSTSASYHSNWSYVSQLQQFSYKDEGLAYAYTQGGKLIIVTPSKEFKLKQLYPKLGDVIADEDGNFYVVWGKENSGMNATVKTVYITKFNSKGKKIKSTGFVGQSSPWGESSAAKTRNPFTAGTCSSVIHNGILICYHAKTRYDGHQSDQVIAVDINTMKPYELDNNTYMGHSFGQDVIYSDKANDFIFASLGDCYSRGFRINPLDASYGNNNEIIFHTYLQANAGYNMHIVNETFAQLGGITQAYDGNVVLAGASVKALSSKAKTQKQNLFIQIMDPTVREVSKSKFIGGKTRNGRTAISMYDTKTKAVSDYGVIWLTDYKDKCVVTPQIITAGKKIVILWNEVNNNYRVETCYMILSAKGKIVKKRSSLGESCLNSFEKPIFYNKHVYWAYADNGTVYVKSIKI